MKKVDMATSISGFKTGLARSPSSSKKQSVRDATQSTIMADAGTSPINDFTEIGLDQVMINTQSSHKQKQVAASSKPSSSSKYSPSLAAFIYLPGSNISRKGFNKENMMGDGLIPHVAAAAATRGDDDKTPSRFQLKKVSISTEKHTGTAQSVSA